MHEWLHYGPQDVHANKACDITAEMGRNKGQTTVIHAVKTQRMSESNLSSFSISWKSLSCFRLPSSTKRMYKPVRSMAYSRVD